LAAKFLTLATNLMVFSKRCKDFVGLSSKYAERALCDGKRGEEI
jgi:hypothetical protein